MVYLGMEPISCYWCNARIVAAPILSMHVVGHYCSEECVALGVFDMDSMGEIANAQKESYGIPSPDEEAMIAAEEVAQYYDEQNEGIDAFQEREYDYEDYSILPII